MWALCHLSILSSYARQISLTCGANSSVPLVDASQFRISAICYSLAAESVVFCDFWQKRWFWSTLAANVVALSNLLYPWRSCQCQSSGKKDQGAARGRAVLPTSHRSVRSSSRCPEAARAHVKCSRICPICTAALGTDVYPINTQPILCRCARRQ